MNGASFGGIKFGPEINTQKGFAQHCLVGGRGEKQMPGNCFYNSAGMGGACKKKKNR